MRCFNLLTADEAGFVLSSELVLLGTLGVIGATVGLSAAARSVNEELTELAFAFRSLDQSYHVEGTRSCRAWTAGSEFIQQDKEESIAELCASIEADEEILEQQLLDTERRLDELRRERDRELNERKSPDAPKGPKKSADGEKPRKKSKGEKKPRNEA